MRLLIPIVLSVLVLPDLSVGQLQPSAADTVGPVSPTIYLQHTFLGGVKYIQGGQSYAGGGSYGKLKEALIDVPDAYELASAGTRIVTHGRLVSVLGAIIGTGSFFVHGDVANWGLTIGGFVVAGVGGAIQMKGKNRIDEAVWTYNECIAQGAACSH